MSNQVELNISDSAVVRTKSLPRQTDECIICFDSGTNENPLVSKREDFKECECRHTFFHENPCYTQYRLTKNICPTCRRGVGIPQDIGELLGMIRIRVDEHGDAVVEERHSTCAKCFSIFYGLGLICLHLFVLVTLFIGVENDPSMSKGDFNSIVGFVCLGQIIMSLIYQPLNIVNFISELLPSGWTRGYRRFKAEITERKLFQGLQFLTVLLGMLVFICANEIFFNQYSKLENNYELNLAIKMMVIECLIWYGFVFVGVCCLMLSGCCS